MKKLDPAKVSDILNANKSSCGAIILNERGDKVLVVESKGKLGFPKGGKNQDETDEDCAAREVREEVGIFVHKMIRSHEKVEVLWDGETPNTFFIVRGFNDKEKLKIDPN